MIFLDAKDAVAEMRKNGFDTVRCCDCKYWVAETHGCTRKPSIEPWWETDYCSYGEKIERPDGCPLAEVEDEKPTPRYCDRNICTENEYNGVSCDECEIAKYHNLEDDDSPCMECEE